MALMMFFSSLSPARYEAMCRQSAAHLGLDYFQTDNIYQFLRYAKEAKPAVVMMDFSPDFQRSDFLFAEIKEALCEKDVCPQIYLNKNNEIANAPFFCHVDFEKFDIRQPPEECRKY